MSFFIILKPEFKLTRNFVLETFILFLYKKIDTQWYILKQIKRSHISI